MLASVYRSTKKDEMYLYVPHKDDFSSVPDPLMKAFGKPEFSMQLNLEKRQKLARVNIKEVLEKMESDGFYLQMPPAIHPNLADKKLGKA